MEQIPAGLICEFAPGALSHGRAFDNRLEQMFGGTSQRVNFPALVKRIIKEALPQLSFHSSDVDGTVFIKPLAQGVETVVSFSKSLPRLGKAFTLDLGVRCSNVPVRLERNLFQLERTTETRSWIYSSNDEATAVISEATGLLEKVLPPFESALRTHFAPWPQQFPPNIQRQGSLTAREAFEKAFSLAYRQFPDATLIRIINHARSLPARDIQGPELSVDGRLTPNGAWWFHFHSPSEDASFEVIVPAVGRIQTANHGEQYKGESGRRILIPIGNDWMDSDRAFAIAEEHGGAERRASGKMWGISTRLVCRSERPSWALMYLVSDSRGRNDFVIHLDAISGEPLEGIRGF
jgi:hypothetical protein